MTMKTKDAIKQLQRAGAIFKRQTGSHRMFEAPSGQVFAIPVSGTHRELSPNVLSSYRRFMREELSA